MAARRAQRARQSESAAGPSAIFAGCGLALLTARYVIPAESAHLGETLWIAEAWLLLAVAWMLLRLRGLAPRMTFDRSDLAVALLVAGQSIASIGVLMTGGHRRAALNMLWEWIAIGIAVVLLRQWLTRSARWPLLWSVIATAGFVLSGLGFWQFAVVYPAFRAEVDELSQLESRYADGGVAESDGRRLQELRRKLGSLATETDANVRFAFRQRLMDSTEPLACFALANTLAGVLAVALLLLLGGLAAALADQGSIGRILRIALPAMLVAGCLILTKSRTAWVGLACGLVAWGGVGARRRWLSLRSLRFVLIGALVTAILIGAAWAAGALDRLVVLETPKSFRYRVEYWTGSWGVIRDNPWLGVGSGNFRQNYLRHKVAGSSEEILDPHNLFLDVWANGGLVALAGLVLCSVRAMSRWWKVSFNSADSPPATTPNDESQFASLRRAAMLSGVAGIGAVLLKSGLVDVYWDSRLVTLMIGWIVAVLVLPLERIGLPAQMAAGIALGVHLLGAGGIAMPVVVTTLLLVWLGPMAQPNAEPERSDATTQRERRWSLAGLLVLASLSTACLLTGVIPATLSSLYVSAASSAVAERGDAATARRFLQDAVRTDGLDPQPHVLLAQLEREQALRQASSDSGDWTAAIDHLTTAISLDPQNSKTHWLDAQCKLEFAERFPSADADDAAVEAAQRAYERDPRNARIAATLAEACAAADRTEDARDAAERALALDRLNREFGHIDKYIYPPEREKLNRMIAQ